MKQIFKSWFLAAVAVLALATFAACSDKDDEPANPLVGSWTQTNDYGTVITVNFKADNTGYIHFQYPGNTGDENENFIYSYNENYLVIAGSGLEGSYTATVTGTTLELVDLDTAARYRFNKK